MRGSRNKPLPLPRSRGRTLRTVYGPNGLVSPDALCCHEEERQIAMATANGEALRILAQLSDNVSWEEIQYCLYVRQKIERAREQVGEGKVLSQEEAEPRRKRWLGEARSGLRRPEMTSTRSPSTSRETPSFRRGLRSSNPGDRAVVGILGRAGTDRAGVEGSMGPAILPLCGGARGADMPRTDLWPMEGEARSSREAGRRSALSEGRSACAATGSSGRLRSPGRPPRCPRRNPEKGRGAGSPP